MRYLKNEEEVTKICKQYDITNWSINKDGLVDVNGNVDLRSEGLTELPLKFGIVSGTFWCNNNRLTTLEGAPKSVVDSFISYDNILITLKGAPKSVGGSFDCSRNKLDTLEGAPESVGDYFNCPNNQLTTLKGAPESVGGSFYCYNNKLTTLEGAPQSVSGNYFFCYNNPLPDLIEKNITWVKHIIANQEMYHIYNKDGSINKYRFQLMMDSMD